MICKSVSRTIVKNSDFSGYDRNITKTAKLSEIKEILKKLKVYCFGEDEFHKENMNYLAAIKYNSQKHHSIL